MLNRKLLNELGRIIKEGYGKNLNQKELFDFGNNLLSFFKLLMKIHFREKDGFEENFVKMNQNLTIPSKSLK